MSLIRSFFVIVFFFLLAVGLYAAVADFTGNDYLKLDPTGWLEKGRESLFKQVPSLRKPARYKFAVFADTHSDNETTAAAIRKAKSLGAQMIVVVGDLTQVGSIDELATQKRLFDESGLEYFVIPGDHDLYNSAGPGNFKQMFGYTNQSFVKNNIHFLLLEAADSLKGIGDAQLKWAQTEIKSKHAPVGFVFMHLPPYHPSSTRTIYQKHQREGEINEKAKQESQTLLKAVAEVKQSLPPLSGVKSYQVFSGDHHLSNRYQEPETKVFINIVGAVARERNLQTSRFDIVSVYDDNTSSIEEIEINK